MVQLIDTAPDLAHIDVEPYFARWDSVLFFPNPAAKENEILLTNHNGDAGSIVCHQHRTCKGLVKIGGKVDHHPPRVCPHCCVDTATEMTEERMQEFNDLMAGKITVIP